MARPNLPNVCLFEVFRGCIQVSHHASVSCSRARVGVLLCVETSVAVVGVCEELCMREGACGHAVRGGYINVRAESICTTCIIVLVMYPGQ